MGKQQLKIKEVASYIEDNYVSIFVIVQMFCFLKQIRKIHHTLYVSLFTILGYSLNTILLINEG